MQPNARPRELHTNHAACGGASTSPVSRITDPSVEASTCRIILGATNIFFLANDSRNPEIPRSNDLLNIFNSFAPRTSSYMQRAYEIWTMILPERDRVAL